MSNTNKLHKLSPLTDKYTTQCTSQADHMCHAIWKAHVCKWPWRFTCGNLEHHWFTLCLKQIKWMGTLRNFIRFWCGKYITSMNNLLHLELVILLQQKIILIRKLIKMIMFILNIWENLGTKLLQCLKWGNVLSRVAWSGLHCNKWAWFSIHY